MSERANTYCFFDNRFEKEHCPINFSIEKRGKNLELSIVLAFAKEISREV